MAGTPDTTAEKEKQFRKNLSMRKILVPILIGLCAAGWLLHRDMSKVRFEPAADGRGGLRMGGQQW